MIFDWFKPKTLFKLVLMSNEGALSDFKNHDFVIGETSFDLNRLSSFSFGI